MAIRCRADVLNQFVVGIGVNHGPWTEKTIVIHVVSPLGNEIVLRVYARRSRPDALSAKHQQKCTLHK